MPRLRILTCNLWGPQLDPAGFDEVLAAVDPDVLAVQELESPAAEVIARRMPHHALDPNGATMGSGIATRLPARFARIPLRYRSAWSAVLSLDAGTPRGQPFEVIGVHMANPVGWPWWRSVMHRRYQLSGILAHCDGSQAARVIVGDFNASPAWPLYGQLTGRFIDGAIAAETERRTWAFQGRTPPLLRIDHAFGENVHFLTTRTVDVPGSDHKGLVVEVAV